MTVQVTQEPPEVRYFRCSRWRPSDLEPVQTSSENASKANVFRVLISRLVGSKETPSRWQ